MPKKDPLVGKAKLVTCFYAASVTVDRETGRVHVVGAHADRDETVKFCEKRGFVTHLIREVHVLEPEAATPKKEVRARG